MRVSAGRSAERVAASNARRGELRSSTCDSVRQRLAAAGWFSVGVGSRVLVADRLPGNRR